MMATRAAVFGAVCLSLLAVGGEARAEGSDPPASLRVGDALVVPEIDVRVRGELRGNRPDFEMVPPPDVHWTLLPRARLGLAVERDALRAKVTVQDARIFGNGLSPVASADAPAPFGPYEAFLEARTSSARPSFVRVGRQAVEWGEGRLLGVADFSPRGRSLDAVRARLSLGELELEALGAVLALPETVRTSAVDVSYAGAQLAGVRAGYTFHRLLGVELFGLARFSEIPRRDVASRAAGLAERARADNGLGTLSLRLAGHDDVWSYGLEGAVQGGKSAGSGVLAEAVVGHVERKIRQIVWSPSLGVSAAYASGGKSEDGTQRTFDPLLPDTQRWHGRFDLFGLSNILDVGGSLELTPATDLKAQLGYRYARLAAVPSEWIDAYGEAIGAVTRGGGRPLGHEASVGLSYEPLPGLTFSAAYATLFALSAAREAYQTRFSQAYVGRGTAIAPELQDVSHYAFFETRLKLP
jgi:hypothetical protein